MKGLGHLLTKLERQYNKYKKDFFKYKKDFLNAKTNYNNASKSKRKELRQHMIQLKMLINK